MYDEFKTKCETFKAELEAVAAECVEGSCLKDHRSGSLYQAIQRTANGINSIVNTINAYYSED